MSDGKLHCSVFCLCSAETHAQKKINFMSMDMKVEGRIKEELRKEKTRNEK
jgi:hypothetical protein